LNGARANTANLLKQFGILPSDSPFTTTVRIDPRETNKPIIKRKILPKPLKGDIASQYDGSKQ